jgi:hypothetical protein
VSTWQLVLIYYSLFSLHIERDFLYRLPPCEISSTGCPMVKLRCWSAWSHSCSPSGWGGWWRDPRNAVQDQSRAKPGNQSCGPTSANTGYVLTQKKYWLCWPCIALRARPKRTQKTNYDHIITLLFHQDKLVRANDKKKKNGASHFYFQNPIRKYIF